MLDTAGAKHTFYTTLRIIYPPARHPAKRARGAFASLPAVRYRFPSLRSVEFRFPSLF